MQKFFKLASYQLGDGKWVPKYCLYIQSGSHTSEPPFTIQNKYFNTKEEADDYAKDFCLQKGYKLAI